MSGVFFSRSSLFPFATLLSLLFLGVFGFSQELPAGFSADRYTDLWKRNPFVLQKAIPQTVAPSRFQSMFLTSWLKQGPVDVVFVQDKNNDEIERITAVPNKSKLRLIEIQTNPDPRLVKAVISDGEEQGVVTFHLEAQTEPDASWSDQESKDAAEGQKAGDTSHFSQFVPAAPKASQTPSPPNAPAVDPSITHRIYPGVPRVHSEGGPPPSATFRQKHPLPTPAPEQPNSGR